MEVAKLEALAAGHEQPSRGLQMFLKFLTLVYSPGLRLPLSDYLTIDEYISRYRWNKRMG